MWVGRGHEGYVWPMGVSGVGYEWGIDWELLGGLGATRGCGRMGEDGGWGRWMSGG